MKKECKHKEKEFNPNLIDDSEFDEMIKDADLLLNDLDKETITQNKKS